MAGNRFINQYYQYTPSGYLGKSLDYTPDLTGLNELATQYQTIWDNRVNADIPIPKYIPTATEKVLVEQQYVNPFMERQEGVIDLLVNDTRKGLNELRKFEKDLLKSQRTGKFKQFEDNYAAYESYKKELNTAVKDEKILSSERDASLAYSLEQFGSSFNEDDVANNFRGQSWAALQDYTGIALDYAKGWKSDKFPQGFEAVGGGYLNKQTKEIVTEKEVYEAITQSLYNNKEVVESAMYRGQLQGLTGADLSSYVETTLQSAAAVAAEKEGFVKITDNLKKDWITEQQRKFKQDFDLMEYEYGIGAGTSELEVQNPKGIGNLATNKVKGGFSIQGVSFGKGLSAPLIMYNGKETTWDKLIKDESFAKKNPNVVKLVEELPRNIGETDKEYNARFKKSWDAIKEKVNTTTLQFDNYGEKMSKRSTSQVIENGYIDRQTIYMIDAQGRTTPVSYAEMIGSKNMNITDEDFKKKAKINGQSKFTNGLAPTGYVGTITVGEDDDAATYNFIVPDNMEHNKTMKDVYKATSILSDYTQDESDVFTVHGKNLRVKKKRVYSKDDKGTILDYNEYPVVTDENGNALYKPEYSTEQLDTQLLELQNNLYKAVENGQMTEEQASNEYFKTLQSVSISVDDIRNMQSRSSVFNPLNLNQFGQVRSPKQDPKFTQIPLNR